MTYTYFGMSVCTAVAGADRDCPYAGYPDPAVDVVAPYAPCARTHA
ncbi:hypothetical protein AB1K54_15850 [Microbacterium sp. BWT-B31]